MGIGYQGNMLLISQRKLLMYGLIRSFFLNRNDKEAYNTP